MTLVVPHSLAAGNLDRVEPSPTFDQRNCASQPLMEKACDSLLRTVSQAPTVSIHAEQPALLDQAYFSMRPSAPLISKGSSSFLGEVSHVAAGQSAPNKTHPQPHDARSPTRRGSGPLVQGTIRVPLSSFPQDDPAPLDQHISP
ncbi:rho-related GTP-binding protein RhoE-like [Sesbania bispinosa]|nr:rho-related GTP-binding protein RhoE-like [Sesbania bispinosa]